MRLVALASLLLAVAVSALGNSQQGFNSELSFDEYTEQSLLWAPYRPNCYFGIRPRNVDQSPFMLGIMWFDNSDASGLSRIRHFVEQGDKLQKYGWEVYDPRVGGREVIIDEANNLNLTIYFTKSHNGENWAVRVHGEPLDPERGSAASVVVYFNQNGQDGQSRLKKIVGDDSGKMLFHGVSKELGEYQLTVRDNFGSYYSDPGLPTMEIVPGCDSSKTAHLSMTVPDENVWMARDVFLSILSDSVKQIVEEKGAEAVNPSLFPSTFTIRNLYDFPAGNFHYLQKSFDNSSPEGFEFDIIYNALDTKERITSIGDVANLISGTINHVETKFAELFALEPKGEQYHSFALETLSNLLGGIGYFHGTQLVDRVTIFDDEQFEEVKLQHATEEGPLSLFTSVPSRAFFPRGFYWDEGFHLLQIMEYDFDLAFVICSSWFDLIEADSGWIAREVILGDEARSKVPEEFRVQNPNIANPPTLLLAFSEMLDRAIKNQESSALEFPGPVDDEITAQKQTSQLENNPDLLLKYAERIYPKLLKHYNWFKTSQKGLIEEYEEILEDEGILEKVHQEEAYTWRGRTINHCLPSGMDDYPRPQPPDVAELNVDALAWVGIMTRSMRRIAHVLSLKDDEAEYQKIENNIIENLDLLHWSEEHRCYCDITIDSLGDGRAFVCHEGYISLLPFALKLVPLDSPKLKHILSLMSDPEGIFSEYGLLSLSRRDEYFGTAENYWRGPVWLNINYLCLDALTYYFPAVVSGAAEGLSPEESQAKQLFVSLKESLVNNVFKNWEERGYCYESYDQYTGKGKGIEHFTGWTALVVNIMGNK
ncbi:hypothetical protein HG536_0D04640 [Torulaspora globosa]|uniref:Mannosyl-oligosaccharide glucosidase n=1 Tax=Torulaspora globosa TaxID=48254 RepID=A0A7G3ZHF6_9SACH|nr:uncharacterized protein HG536_0D04640 [Torulaspora globosa]QLL32942.1 hypothetical protein HG536_0D04640 [Torulaspora globosa]